MDGTGLETEKAYSLYLAVLGNELSLVTDSIWVIYGGVLLESEPWYVYKANETHLEAKTVKVRGNWAKTPNKSPIIMLNEQHAIHASYDTSAPQTTL